MASLYIDRRSASIDIQAGQLRVCEPGERPRGFPLSMLERVVLASNVSLESRVITQLIDNGCSILFAEGRGARHFAHVAGSRHGDAARRLGQYRLCSTTDLSLALAKRLVRSRAAGCLRTLRLATQQRADLRRPLQAALESLVTSAPRIRSCASLESLRGIEGANAAAFFRAYTTLFPAGAGFTQRNRRPPRDPVNAALSLGYSLTHVECVRQCHLAGLDPMLGVYHQPSHGRESLACDLNELVRHQVEQLIWRLFAEQTLRPSQFESHNGGVFLQKDARQAFFAAFEAQARPHRRILRVAAGMIARHCRALGPAESFDDSPDPQP